MRETSELGGSIALEFKKRPRIKKNVLTSIYDVFRGYSLVGYLCSP